MLILAFQNKEDYVDHCKFVFLNNNLSLLENQIFLDHNPVKITQKKDGKTVFTASLSQLTH